MKRPVDQSRRLSPKGSPPTGGGTGRKPDALIVITIDANKPLDRNTLNLLRSFLPVERFK